MRNGSGSSLPSNRGNWRPPIVWGLQGDAYALARSGLIPATQFLQLAPSLSQ